MTKVKLLAVDDEAILLSALVPFLERSGFEVVSATDGEQALERISKVRPDLILLDIQLPRINGREVLRRLRQAGNWTPVIMLTQIQGEASAVLAEGADDYVTKPYDKNELVARIQAVLRRIQRGQPPLTSFPCLVSGDLILRHESRQVFLAGQEVPLNIRSIEVLKYLMLHFQEIISRERLLQEVWGFSTEVSSTRVVDVRIAELRKKLGDDADKQRFIETIIGVGYRFIAHVEGQRCDNTGAIY